MADYGPCEGSHNKCTLCKDGEVKVGLLGAPNKRTGVRRVRSCGDPVARGARNRRKGKTKQRAARRQVGVEDSPVPNSLADEESWTGPFLVEVKAGQQVKALTTRFVKAEDQANASRSASDSRPFALVAMPDGWGSEGIVAMRLSDFEKLVLPALETVPAP